ncbi:MAG: DUF2232 domain-containing protein [Candidatus Firestonebacteria bacterium]|nr:DUF2232 domain-containing protein [Candidatus Firestonebacteria bacterium]
MVISTKSIVEGALLVLISVIMYLLGIYNIALGFISALLCPVPIILLVLRHDVKVIFSGFFISILILLTLAGLIEAQTFVLEFLLPGYVMGYFIKKDNSPEKVIFMTSIIYVINTLIFMVITSKILEKDILGDIVRSIEVSFDGFMKLYKENGIDAAKIAILQQQKDFIIELFKHTYPAFFVCVSFITMTVNYKIVAKIAGRVGHYIKEIDISRIRIPEYFIWAFILACIIKYINITLKMPEFIFIERIAENIIFILLASYFIQGISIAVIYMKKWRFPSFFIIINMIMFILLSPLQFIPLFLGIFDFWFDFRKRLINIGQKQA